MARSKSRSKAQTSQSGQPQKAPADQPQDVEHMHGFFPINALASGHGARRKGWTKGCMVLVADRGGRGGVKKEFVMKGMRSGQVVWAPNDMTVQILADDWEIVWLHEDIAGVDTSAVQEKIAEAKAVFAAALDCELASRKVAVAESLAQSVEYIKSELEWLTPLAEEARKEAMEALEAMGAASE